RPISRSTSGRRLDRRRSGGQGAEGQLRISPGGLRGAVTAPRPSSPLPLAVEPVDRRSPGGAAIGRHLPELPYAAIRIGVEAESVLQPGAVGLFALASEGERPIGVAP